MVEEKKKERSWPLLVLREAEAMFSPGSKALKLVLAVLPFLRVVSFLIDLRIQIRKKQSRLPTKFLPKDFLMNVS